jgi:hypothetical protein
MLNNEEMRKKGYAIFTADGSEFYIPDAEHIEKIDELNMFESDEEASAQAEKDGVQLIRGMDGVPDGVYVDTIENREIISDALLKWPEYKEMAVTA